MKPHPQIVSTGKWIVLLCAALGFLLLPGKVVAQTDITGQNTYSLTNGGSTATVNVGNTGTLGMNSWTVLGNANQLNQQWFWYSVNGSTPQPINTISAATVYNEAPSDPTLDNLGVLYQQTGGLEVFAQFTLGGNGNTSGSADFTEGVYVINNSSQAINLSFYQYSNFNLLMNNNNSVTVFGSLAKGYTGAQQTTGGPGGTAIGEAIVGPDANAAEAGFATSTMSDVLSGSLTDGTNPSAGPGDVAWAFQWNVTQLAPGGMLDLTKDLGLTVNIVPEPSTLALIALGMAALGLAFRRKLA